MLTRFPGISRCFLLLGVGCSTTIAVETTPLLDEYFAVVAAREAGETGPLPPETLGLGHPGLDQDLANERDPAKTRGLNWDPTRSLAEKQHLPASRSIHAPMHDQGLPADSGYWERPTHGAFSDYGRFWGQGEPNMVFGPLELDFSGFLSLNGSDNHYHSEQDRQKSLMVSGGILTEGSWQLTSDQALEFSLGLGLDYWIDGPGDGNAETGETDFSIIPGSELSYTIYVGEHISLELYDQFQIRRNRDRNEYSLDAESVSDFWMNAAGARLSWFINDETTLAAGYEIGRRESLEDEFSGIDYDWQSASLRLAQGDGAGIVYGIEGAASWADYADSSRNDLDSYSIGLFADWLLTDYTSIYGSVGYEEWQSSGIDDSFEDSGFYVAAGIRNALNDRFNHQFSFGRNSSLSEFADLSQNDFLRYQLDWDITDTTRLSGVTSYAISEEMGNGRSERSKVLYAGAQLRQILSEHLTVGLSASHSDHDSNLAERDYYEQRGQGWLSWNLNPDVALTLSYEHWRASGDVHFEENRFLLSSSLSF